jgi:SAM-dependent methyltransferase
VFERLGETLRAYANKDGRGYPDWALRYAPVARALRGRTNGLILEIGANENGLARFVACDVVAVDLSMEHLRAARAAQRVRVVAADASALPFADDAFAAGVCMDTLEHIPANRREAVCAELVRTVTDAGVAVVAFPSGDAATRAEQAVRKAHRRYTGGTIRWLEEHDAEGLPDPAGLAAALSRVVNDRRRVRRSRNANVFVWRAMWRVLACGWPGRGNALFQALLRFMTPVLSRAHFGTCYRSVIWVEPRS